MCLLDEDEVNNEHTLENNTNAVRNMASNLDIESEDESEGNVVTSMHAIPAIAYEKEISVPLVAINAEKNVLAESSVPSRRHQVSSSVISAGTLQKIDDDGHDSGKSVAVVAEKAYICMNFRIACICTQADASI